MEGEMDEQLPPRLFATDRFPSARMNVYSKPDLLLFLTRVLEGTEAFARIKNSCFGVLFNYYASRCSISCKLIHSLLGRQLVTKRKYELWIVFGGKPFRFSLKDFGKVTGLPCGEYPERYDPESEPLMKKAIDPSWIDLFGETSDYHTTLADVADLLANNTDMEEDRRTKLALIMIVDGVLIAKTQMHKPSLKYVKMVRDIDEFLRFPWGRESFIKTIKTMTAAKKSTAKCEDPVWQFRQQLQQQTFRLQGFPLGLQLVAFEAIPSFLSLLPELSEDTKLVDYKKEKLPNSTISESDILEIENTEKVVIHPYVWGEEEEIVEGWGEWDDEVKDKKVAYLEKKIEEGTLFNKGNWPGGDASLPLIVHKHQTAKKQLKKHVVNRGEQNGKGKSFGKKSTATKRKRQTQRKIDEYVKVTGEGNQCNCQHLSTQMSKLTTLVEELSKRFLVTERRTSVIARNMNSVSRIIYRKDRRQVPKICKKRKRENDNPEKASDQHIPELLDTEPIRLDGDYPVDKDEHILEKEVQKDKNISEVGAGNVPEDNYPDFETPIMNQDGLRHQEELKQGY